MHIHPHLWLIWVRIKFKERELYNRSPSEASIERIKELSKGKEGNSLTSWAYRILIALSRIIKIWR